MTLPAKKPTEAELNVLRALWARGSATVRDLHDALPDRSTAYTTVLKTLQIMTEKGLVTREQVGQAHVYSPAMREDDMRTQLLKELSDKLFSGSPGMLAMHALSLEPVDEGEFQQIKALFESRRDAK